MGPKPSTLKSNDLFRQRLDELVNPKHPLAQLAQHIDWSVFEHEWGGFFPSGRGRPAPRLVAGLMYLQHTFGLSDEEVIWGWVENPYWQLFCGETWFQHNPPIDPSSLTRWRCHSASSRRPAVHPISATPSHPELVRNQSMAMLTHTLQHAKYHVRADPERLLK